MDFGALPPEINSARMHSGSGSESMWAAATAWDKLADDLYGTAAAFNAIVVALSDDNWRGDAADAMVAAVTPFTRWLTNTAGRAEAMAGQARAAASAFEDAFAATVPPPLIDANRARLTALIEGNVVSQDTPSITALEADYAEMWAQDASAMYRYAGASASAATSTSFASPMVGFGADDGVPDTLAQAMAAVPRALRSLGQPAQSAAATAAMTAMLRARPFALPLNAFAAAISSPASMTSSGTSAVMSMDRSDAKVSVAWGRGVLVGRLSVPPRWGEIAYGGLRSVARAVLAG